MLILIVATDDKSGIGKNGTIPWASRADMKHFKETTTGNTVLMGYNTFKSLGFKPLPNRKNVVILNAGRAVPPELQDSGAEILYNTEVYEYLCTSTESIYLIGGAAIYKEYSQYCDYLIHTSIMGDYECDTVFNPLEGMNWEFKRQNILNDGSVVRYYSMN